MNTEEANILERCRITTPFYRTAKPFGHLGYLYARLFAMPQGNGRMKIRLDEWNTGAEPLLRIPGFIQDWLAVAENRNLTVEEAMKRLRSFSAYQETQGYVRDGFSGERYPDRYVPLLSAVCNTIRNSVTDLAAR